METALEFSNKSETQFFLEILGLMTFLNMAGGETRLQECCMKTVETAVEFSNKLEAQIFLEILRVMIFLKMVGG